MTDKATAMQRLHDIFAEALPKAPATCSWLTYSEEIDALTEIVGNGVGEIMREAEAKGFDITFIPRVLMQAGDSAAPSSKFMIKRR